MGQLHVESESVRFPSPKWGVDPTTFYPFASTHFHIEITSTIIIWQGKSECSNWFFLPYGPFPWKHVLAVYFLFSKASKFKTSITRAPYNKLLTNLASLSHTGEYWPSVVFVWTSLRSICTATTLGQHSPVRPLRSVSKRLIFCFKI